MTRPCKQFTFGLIDPDKKENRNGRTRASRCVTEAQVWSRPGAGPAPPTRSLPKHSPSRQGMQAAALRCRTPPRVSPGRRRVRRAPLRRSTRPLSSTVRFAHHRSAVPTHLLARRPECASRPHSCGLSALAGSGRQGGEAGPHSRRGRKAVPPRRPHGASGRKAALQLLARALAVSAAEASTVIRDASPRRTAARRDLACDSTLSPL